MVFGEERLFIIEYPGSPLGIKEFILKFTGKDQYGFKMKGQFPNVWTEIMGKVAGPLLYDEDTIYETVMVDYDNNFLWINRIVDNL